MSIRKDYGPTGCAKPIRNGALLLAAVATLLVTAVRR